ncbi:MAG: hypothetical protein OXE46_15225 [Chloroflexi bacterium]|nr:hypothetical protein [Chloroflexota bacterium]
MRMVARMCAYCTALTALSFFVFCAVLSPLLFPGDTFVPISIMLVDFAFESVVTGLALGLPMALLTAVCFREIRRPTFYRFTMLTSSLVIVILFLSEGAFSFSFAPLTWFALFLEYDLRIAALLLVVVSKFGLAAYMSHVAAGKYLRDLQAQQPIATDAQ